jgi:hypothetical protein
MNTESKSPKSLWWFEPRWSYVPRVKGEMSFLFLVQFKMWLRVLVEVILLTALLAYYVKREIPDLDFDWAGNLAFVIGAFILALGGFVALSFILPPIVAIKSAGVTRQEGQHAIWRRRADIRRITIDVTDPSRPLLKIEAAGKKPFESGISAKVSTAELTAFLRSIFPELSVEQKK